MGICSHVSKLCFKSCLILRVRIDFVVRQVRPLGHIDALLRTFMMHCYLFSLTYDTNHVFVPPNCYLFCHKMAGNGVVGVFNMNMTIGTNRSYSPVKKCEGLIRQRLELFPFLSLKQIHG